MTTTRQETTAEEVRVGRPTDATLKLRFWIGQNPALFVGVCLAGGYLIGKSSVIGESS